MRGDSALPSFARPDECTGAFFALGVAWMTEDESYMRLALEISKAGLGRTSPNPIVGAVLVKDGRVVGLGAHLRAGAEHAEVHALRMAGSLAQGATLYVTLEPCSHYGRTPPCADAVVQAGVSRVVAAMADPFWQVRGRGIERLRAAGIRVEVGCLEQAVRRANRAYLRRVENGRPFVTLKMAVTLDGYIAADSGRSRYVTGPGARQEVARLRDEADAVLIGIGTALADDPLLTVRGQDGEPLARQPLRAVVDSKLRLPVHFRLVTDKTSQTMVICLPEAASGGQADTLRECGVSVVAAEAGPDGRPAPGAVLRALAGAGVNHVLLEGGGLLATAFLRDRAVDEVWWFQSRALLFSGVRALAGAGTPDMDAALSLVDVTTREIGPDLLTVGTPNYAVDRR